MRVIVTSWGSGGDVLPFVDIGAELRRHGHEVTVVANPAFAGRAGDVGLPFVPAGTHDEYRALAADPHLWQWSCFAERLYTHWSHGVGAFHEALQRTVEAKRPDVIVAHVLVAGAGIVAESTGIPWVSIVLSPMVISPTHGHPARPMPAWGRGGRVGRALVRRYLRLSDRLARRAPESLDYEPSFLASVDGVRERAGLQPTLSWMLSPQHVIGCWPQWFAPLAPDAPPQAQLTGFVLPERATTATRPATDRTPPDGPIVFTAGTVASHERAFYEAAVAACIRLGKPGLLIMPRSLDLSRPLPAHVRRTDYARFSDLLPSASMIVHHGGIGTIAEALSAGIPQVVLPMAGDHFDNAERVATLGVGLVLPRDSTGLNRLVRTIRTLARSTEVAARCRLWQERLDRASGTQRAASAIESIVQAAPPEHAAASS